MIVFNHFNELFGLLLLPDLPHLHVAGDVLLNLEDIGGELLSLDLVHQEPACHMQALRLLWLRREYLVDNLVCVAHLFFN